MTETSGRIVVSTSDIFPPTLVDFVKSEVRDLRREGRTRTFSIDIRALDGFLVEARFRTRERVIVVPLVAGETSTKSS